MPATETFGEWLQTTFGPLPALDLGALVAVGPRAWASPGLAAPLPIVPEFRADPGDYALAGHWGRGGASEAVYVVERRGPHRAFLRLPWAGAYGDPDRDRALVREALSSWARFRALAPMRFAASEVVSNMQSERAVLVARDGAAREVLGPTPLEPDRPPFWPALLAIAGAP